MVQMFHVFKAFPGGISALSDVNLHVHKGEFVFLTGPSGAGKTTVLKLILCAEKPTSGQILVGGRNVARIRDSAIPYLRRSIGVIFQDFKLLPHFTVAENVALTLHVLGISRTAARRQVLAMLRRVGLEQKADLFPPQLSGGEQQRVAIARALVNDPMLVMADEPTGNLDPTLTVEIMDLLCSINARGTTVMVATHDTSLLNRYHKRIIQLEKGLVVADHEGTVLPSRLAAG
jgi:cell division transport system ATP-binding protein